ncbi:MAG TPA: hypothetical protein VFJ17_12845 [Mycobacteriales bacterium]|nr:hypothetical protein [Mycobacteriales bacterium]
MTVEQPAPGAEEAAVRGVRRIFLVALAAALVAAGLTLGLELSHQRTVASVVVPAPLPLTFRQAGFVEHDVRRSQVAGFPTGSRHGDLHVTTTGGTLYVVARCTVGRVRIVVGSLTSEQACTGRPVGVVALGQVRRPLQITVTVSAQQTDRWAVGIYR